MNARTALPTLTLGVLLLTGCTSPTVEPPALTASPTTSATPEPSPTPTDGIQIHSNTEAGILFDDVPDLTGDEAEVYNWIATYQKAFWETLRTNEVSDTFAAFTSAEVQDSLAQPASNNAAHGFRVGGTFTTWIRDIAVTGETATAVNCDDLREATFATDAGTFSAEDVGQGVPQRYRVELLRLDSGTWYINRFVKEGTC